MNTTNYKQFDTRWAKLPYRDNPDNIGNNGCGEVAVCNSIIEMVSQMNQTPETMQPYCRQYACHDGTYWSGIPKMLEHYGCTEVMEHQNMASLWKELAKGNRVAIYMMNCYPAGYLKKKWTSGGHFICSGGYRYNSQNGEHEVYIKDSNSISEDRNGWMSYESSLRGDVSACWSGKLNGSPAPTPTPTPTGKLVVDGIGGYETVKRLQEFLKLSDPDGLIGNQRSANEKWYPSLTAVSFSTSGGSKTVTALQKWLGLSDPDGILGKNTTGALQRRLRDYGYLAKDETIDAVFGTKSMKALQTALNNDFKKTDPTPPTPTPTKYTKVIDVSAFQDGINWKNVKADGIVGAMVRCGYRGYETGKLNEDSMFLKHIKGAYNAGLKVGVYFFTEAINWAEGKEEAEYTMRLIEKSGVNLYYPIAVDTEAQSAPTERAKNLSKAQRTDAIKGFCETIKERGGTPMIYASTSWFENKLDMSKLPYKIWCAQYYKECQYKGEVSMWQYTSEGSVAGVKGVVDMNKCYITKASPQPKPTPSGHYTGKYPEVRLKKTNAQVIADAVKFAKWIAGDNHFHYGYGSDAHHNGCYFCGTQWQKKGHGIKEYEHTYCCNPFVGACWAHGGGDATAYKMCHSCDSWDFGTGNGSYEKSGLFTKLGKPAKSKLKAGDVLCNSHHVALYVGDGKIAEAGHTDDNVVNSTSWNTSIEVSSLTDSRYKDFDRVYRYDGKVDCDRIITKGEVSDRVADLQKYLVWYGALPKDEDPDGIYGKKTFDAVVKMQTDFFGADEADGTIGNKTIAKMKEVVR